jgi:hypothetical protein
LLLGKLSGRREHRRVLTVRRRRGAKGRYMLGDRGAHVLRRHHAGHPLHPNQAVETNMATQVLAAR